MVCSHSHKHNRQAGRTSDLIWGVLLLTSLGLGFWWIFKTMGQGAQQYGDAMVNTQQRSTELTCQINLRSLWQAMQVCVATEGTYPEDTSALSKWCGDSRLLHCPDPNGGPYLYFRPKGLNSSSPKIVLCDTHPVHGDQCCVLLSNGQIGLMPPSALKDMLSLDRSKTRNKAR